MRSLILILFLLYAWIPVTKGQDIDSVMHSLFLVGDGGEHYVGKDPIGDVLKKSMEEAGSNATVVFLGDNIYPKGMPEQGHRLRGQAEAIMQSQIEWLPVTGAKAIFIPGNHDWHHWGRHGQAYMRNQQLWIDSLKNDYVSLLPRDGCPGPVEIPLDDHHVLVLIDTQWPLHQWEKPGEESSCDAKTTEDLLSQLNDVLFRNRRKRVIVAGHHPLITYGEHGGVFTLRSHIFPLTEVSDGLYIPLPVAGSIYPLFRKWFGHNQDTKHPVYRQFSEAVQKILAQYPGSMYVAGHEHALEYIVRDSTHMIVSGSGAKTEFVRRKGYAKFAADVRGFVKLQLRQSGAVDIVIVQADQRWKEGKVVYETKVPFTPRKVDSSVTHSDQPAFVKVRASGQYRASETKKKLLGENYRREWNEEIEVPVFDIGREKGGLKILQRGGGQQTLSLRLEDSAGHEYVIRTIEKFPEKAVPEVLRKTFVQDLVQDQISAAHPYGALIVPSLAKSAGIYHTNPKLAFIPDDDRFGDYQQTFANTLVIFEERPSGDWSEAEHFGNSSKIINTTKVLENLAEDNDHRVDQPFTLRSRLFDMIIGDWDRHDDQWRWASFKNGKGNLYRPIPRDRDQAFFVNEGKISRIWSRRWALPKFEGFDEEIDWPSGLSFNARYFDRSFLNELSLDDWKQIAQELKQALNDEAIERAVKVGPEEVFAYSGPEIIKALKRRRDDIARYAEEHYLFLAREVDVAGSDKNEIFEVIRLQGGDVSVKIFKRSKRGEKGRLIYSRHFRRSETREVRLYGLKGEDEFYITGAERNSILIRVIGGEEQDKVSDLSKGSNRRRTVYYDLEDERNELEGGDNIIDRQTSDGDVNRYDRKAFKYNRLAPLIYGNYNFDDGLFLGGGFIAITHGFRKDPYKQRHLFLASAAPLTGSYNFLYQGRFTQVVGPWDVHLNADVKSPNYVNNFFGWGNESKFDRNIDDKPGIDVHAPIQYYRYRFEEMRVEAFLSRRISNWGRMSIGPTLQRIEMEEPGTGEDRFITAFAATLSEDLFNEYQSFGGAGWSFQIDKVDHQQITTRGVRWLINGRNMVGLSEQASDFGSYESSLSFYHSFKLPSRIVFALRFGGGVNTGEYQFYQAQVLDGKTELRGFRKTRFYGDRKLYGNAELRLKVASIRTYLFPASVGITAFHDMGRVWYKDASGKDPSAKDGSSQLWHRGYGGGIWLSPFNLTVISAEVANSDDGLMVHARLGFLF